MNGIFLVSGASPKIDVYNFAETNAEVSLLRSNNVPNAAPTFLAINSHRKVIYAIDEQANNIQSYSLNLTSGVLKLMATFAMGGGPTHIALDNAGKYAFAATYGSGTVAAFPISNDVATGIKSIEIAGQNAHQVCVSPDNQFIFVPCLGSNDIAQYSFTDGILKLQGKLQFVGIAGPRHMVFHPNGQWAYVVHELASMVQAMAYDSVMGMLSILNEPASSLEDRNTTNSAASIQVHPNGRFLYVSNRGDDSIAVFDIGDNGKIALRKTMKTGGKIPRHLALNQAGTLMLVANQGSNEVRLMAVNYESGELSLLDKSLAYQSPQFVEFLLI